MDLLIHDAQYTLAEYAEKLGWGHTPAERAVDFALAAGARQLALFHHDPLRDDDALDRLVKISREHAGAAGAADAVLDVFAAAEGLVIELIEGAAAARATVSQAVTVKRPMVDGAEQQEVPPDVPEVIEENHSLETVLIVDDDPDVVELLNITLGNEGFRIISAYDGETALETVHRERPDLVLLDWLLPGENGLEVTRAMRADTDEHIRTIPVVLLTSMVGAEETAAAFEAGATDYLTKPFTPAHVRTRVRGWLLRARSAD